MTPLRVCVIGGGPAAMFLCHAWNRQRKEDTAKELQPLDITCFEMKSTPGGIWRESSSADSGGNDDLLNDVYDELWTNGPGHALEFHDLSFDDHFGEPITVFLPRKDLHDYLMARVTKSAPTFFQDFFEFNTKVLSVDVQSSSGTKEEFLVTLQDMLTGHVSERQFDRCIWAAGENCQGYVPKALERVFCEKKNAVSDRQQSEMNGMEKECKTDDGNIASNDGTGFCLLHSGETQKIREHSRGCKVLLIGGGFSAEDLALQCLKWGATHVDVVARQVDSEITWMSQWPRNKVQVHKEMAIDSVSAGVIRLKMVEEQWPVGYKCCEETEDDDVFLEGIQTVVCCTGYNADLSMLRSSLQPACGAIPSYKMSPHPSLFLTDIDWSSFQMNTNHKAHAFTGEIPFGKKRMMYSNYHLPDIYRGFLLKNPHMMYLCEDGSDFPLIALDVNAWLLCSYLTGRLPMLSQKQMEQNNWKEFLDKMNYPTIRYLCDEAYFDAISTHLKYWGEREDNDGNSLNEDEDSPSDFDEEDAHTHKHLCLFKLMEESNYPGLPFSNGEKLNKCGRRILEFDEICYEMRTDLKTDYPNDVEWRTYRDGEEAEMVFSLYTGTPCRQLKSRWMDCKDGDAVSILIGNI